MHAHRWNVSWHGEPCTAFLDSLSLWPSQHNCTFTTWLEHGTDTVGLNSIVKPSVCLSFSSLFPFFCLPCKFSFVTFCLWCFWVFTVGKQCSVMPGLSVLSVHFQALLFRFFAQNKKEDTWNVTTSSIQHFCDLNAETFTCSILKRNGGTWEEQPLAKQPASVHVFIPYGQSAQYGNDIPCFWNMNMSIRNNVLCLVMVLD